CRTGEHPEWFYIHHRNEYKLCQRDSFPTGASCIDRRLTSEHRLGICRCTCRTLRTPGGRCCWEQSWNSILGYQLPAPKRPCPRRKRARSDNTECIAVDQSKPPETTAARRGDS